MLSSKMYRLIQILLSKITKITSLFDKLILGIFFMINVSQYIGFTMYSLNANFHGQDYLYVNFTPIKYIHMVSYW